MDKKNRYVRLIETMPFETFLKENGTFRPSIGAIPNRTLKENSVMCHLTARLVHKYVCDRGLVLVCSCKRNCLPQCLPICRVI